MTTDYLTVAKVYLIFTIWLNREKCLVRCLFNLYLGILSRKFLLRQHDNGNLIVATMTTITTMKNPDKITQNGDI